MASNFFQEHGYIFVEDAIHSREIFEIEERCDDILANKETMAFDWA